MELTLVQKIEKAKNLIKEYFSKFTDKHSLAFSGGKDSAVLAHLACEALGDDKHKLRIDAVLSDTEFDETLEYIKEFADAYGLGIREHYYTNTSENPDDASRDNKVAKFKEVMSDVDCWFAGIRRDEGATRTEIQDVEERDGLIKVNPIADFTEKDVWRYLAIYRIPVNKAYIEGYRSLSCKLSSKPEERGDEGERAGRWKGSTCEGGECGIHSKSLRVTHQN